MQYILDTNYWRGYVQSQLEQGVNVFIQNQRNVEEIGEVLFPNIVAIELIKHLNNSDPACKACLYALLALFSRATKIDNRHLIVIPTYHNLLTKYFFDGVSKNFHEINGSVVNLIHRIYDNEGGISQFEQEIQNLTNFKKQEVKSMIRNLEEYYLPSFTNDNSVDWNIFQKNDDLKSDFEDRIKDKTIHKLFGLSMLKMAESEVKEQPSFTSSDFFINNFLSDFQVSIDFFVEKILKKLVEIEKMEYFYEPETDKDKRWNSFYDFQLIFATEFEISKGRDTIFVTKDKLIRSHFNKYGKEQYVMLPEEYDKKRSK